MQTYVNEFDKDKVDITDGKRAESNFVRLFKNKFGVEPLRATEFDDKHNHIDFYLIVKKGDTTHKITTDIKSWKKEPEHVWVELVSYGKLGWLYGKADYIGFEMPDEKSFIMVKRVALVSLIKTACVAEFTNNKDEALFRLYVRYKGKDNDMYDCITKIPRSMLLEIEHWVLE